MWVGEIIDMSYLNDLKDHVKRLTDRVNEIKTPEKRMAFLIGSRAIILEASQVIGETWLFWVPGRMTGDTYNKFIGRIHALFYPHT